MYDIQMSLSKKLGIGVACLVIISFVAYSYISNHNNSGTNNIITAPSNATNNIVIAPSNATNIAANVHHYQVKVNELISLGERTK